MEKRKIDLSNIKGKLSNAEMKNVIAGDSKSKVTTINDSDDPEAPRVKACKGKKQGTSCTYSLPDYPGVTYSGFCVSVLASPSFCYSAGNMF
jgi:hypothetical protein